MSDRHPMLPPEVADQLAATMRRITDEVASVGALAHSLPAPLAHQLRRRGRGEILALADLLLASPPCTLCPPTGGCSSATCRVAG